MSEWMPIACAAGYEVSRLGEVRGPRKLLSPFFQHGRLCVHLRTAKERRIRSVDELVLTAFAGEPPSGATVRHVNGDQADNNAQNLEWFTSQSDHAEAWMPVRGRNGYEVSSLGRVRCANPINAVARKPPTPRVLAIRETHVGYMRVCMSVNGRSEYASVHRLVLEAFIGPCPPGMECCHNNGNRRDNRLENLRWDTHAANEADKKRHKERGHAA